MYLFQIPLLTLLFLVIFPSNCVAEQSLFRASIFQDEDNPNPSAHRQLVLNKFPNIFDLARQPFGNGTLLFSTGLNNVLQEEPRGEGSDVKTIIQERENPPKMESVEPYPFEPIVNPGLSQTFHERLKEEITMKINAINHSHQKVISQPLVQSDPLLQQESQLSETQTSVSSVKSGKSTSRNSINNFNDGPKKPYSFAYVVNNKNGNNFSQKETSDGTSISGSYRVLLPDNRVQTVMYMADKKHGYNAIVTYEGSSKNSVPVIHQQQLNGEKTSQSSVSPSTTVQLPSGSSGQRHRSVSKSQANFPPPRHHQHRQQVPPPNFHSQFRQESPSHHFPRYASHYLGTRFPIGRGQGSPYPPGEHRFNVPMAAIGPAIQIPLYHPPLLPTTTHSHSGHKIVLHHHHDVRPQEILTSYPLKMMAGGHNLYMSPVAMASLMASNTKPPHPHDHSMEMSQSIHYPHGRNVMPMPMPPQNSHHHLKNMHSPFSPSYPDPYRNSEYVQSKLLAHQFPLHSQESDRMRGNDPKNNSVNRGQRNLVYNYSVPTVKINESTIKTQSEEEPAASNIVPIQTQRDLESSVEEIMNKNIFIQQIKFDEGHPIIDKIQELRGVKLNSAFPVPPSSTEKNAGVIDPLHQSVPIIFNKNLDLGKQEEFLISYSPLPEPRVRTSRFTGGEEEDDQLIQLHSTSQLNKTLDFTNSSSPLTTTTTVRPGRRRVVKRRKKIDARLDN